MTETALLAHFRAMARNNAWSNDRLYAACRPLSAETFAARRTSFFPSLVHTLNHILTVDWYYLDVLEGGRLGCSVFEPEIPFPTLEPLCVAQHDTDRRLIAFCNELDGPGLARIVHTDRGERGRLPERTDAVLAHLFVHQIHHRGQVHAMLSGTDAAPPQLDEFFLDQDLPLRADEMKRLGFD